MTAIASTPAELLHAHVERGRALSAQGRDDDVIGTLQHALADDAAAGAGDTAVLRAFALVLVGESLQRQGRHAQAILACEGAPTDLAGPGGFEARTRLLLGIAFAHAHQSAPEQALQMADAALRLALAQRLTALAAAALECVALCQIALDDLMQADRLMHESLGLALQSGDQAAVQRCLANLMLLTLTQIDACHQQGDADGARLALLRCASLAGRGERLLARAGLYERCQWRAYRGGWQLRRGNPEEARVEFFEVEREALARRWPALIWSARLALATIEHAQQRDAQALEMLGGVLDAEAEMIGYELPLQAHRLAQDILTSQGRHAAAAAHRLARVRLAGQRAAERALAAQKLPHFGSGLLEVVASGDRTVP